MEIMTHPPAGWMTRLRRGNAVWLVKENEQAWIEYPYEPAEPGHLCGRIGLRRALTSAGLGIQAWFVGLEGQGIDGSRLIDPMVGELPENPEPLPEPLVRQMQRQLERLESRVRQLENRSWISRLFID